MPDVFRSHPDDKFVTRMHVFIGKNTVFGERKKQVPGAPATPRPTFANIRDGTSNTILVLHAAAGHKMEWTRPNDLAYDPESPKNAVEALDGSDIQCAMADGEVVRLPPDIDPQSFGALVTANGKEIVDVGSLKRQALPPAGTPDSASPAGAEAALVAQNRKADSSKLKSIGGAILNYSDLNLSFPVSGRQARFFDDQGHPKLSWRVHILRYLDQQSLFDQFKLDEPWDSPNNKPLLDKMPAHGVRIDFAAEVVKLYDLPPNAGHGIVAGMPRGLARGCVRRDVHGWRSTRICGGIAGVFCGTRGPAQ